MPDKRSTIPSALRLLIIEDDKEDAYLIREMLADVRGEVKVFQAERLASALEQLAQEPMSLVLLDLGLPDSQGIETLRTLVTRMPSLPVIVLTGLRDREFGIMAIQEGAQDFLVKGQINADLLSRAIAYALERKKLENEKHQLIEELQEALAKVKTLSGMLPICSSCKQIRDDKGYWNQVDTYIHEHADVEFSHALCPDCAKKLYPDYYDKMLLAKNNKKDPGQ